MEQHDPEAVTEAAKQAMEETARNVDSWLEQRRKIAAQNDAEEDADRQRYFREREEAMREREARVRKKLQAAGVSLETIKRLLANTPEEIE